MQVMKNGLHYDDSRQLATIQLPAQRGSQWVDATMLPPSSDGQLMKDEVASQ